MYSKKMSIQPAVLPLIQLIAIMPILKMSKYTC